jgi:hypothetical protein
VEQTSCYQKFDVIVGPSKNKKDIYKMYLFRVERGNVAAIPSMSWCFFISDVQMRREDKEGTLEHLLYRMEWEILFHQKELK